MRPGKAHRIGSPGSPHRPAWWWRLPSPGPLTTLIPLLGLALLAVTWGTEPRPTIVALIGVALVGNVIAGVHHAEVIGHRVGEPFGSLVLAVAVIVIEVALIVTVMVSSANTETLARDTVFAAVMITCNGVVGIALLVGALRKGFATFNAEGSATALATVLTLATLCLVVPRFTSSRPGPELSPGQLAFAAVASLGLYTLFIVVQTVRHRDLFAVDGAGHDDVDSPSTRAVWTSASLLAAALIAVVGLAKVSSPSIESAVQTVGAPISAVGVVIALLILAPRNAHGDPARAARPDPSQLQPGVRLGDRE